MKPLSYPSTPITFLDVPDVKRVRSKFTYNFYVPDESVSFVEEAKTRRVKLERLNRRGRFNPKKLKSFETKLPRFVTIRFRPVTTKQLGIFGTRDFNIGSGDFDIQKNKNNILDENFFANDNFSIIILSDDMSDGKLSQYIESLSLEDATSQFAVFDRKMRALQSLNKSKNRKILNVKDITRALNNSVKEKKLLDATGNNEKLVKDQIENSVRSVRLPIRLNSKFGIELLRMAQEDKSSIFNDEIASEVERFEIKSRRAKKKFEKEGAVEENDYIQDAVGINYRIIEHPSPRLKIEIKGYILEKYMFLEDNTLEFQKNFYIKNKNSSAFVDTEVMYGKKYAYSIRAVYIAELPSESDLMDENLMTTILVASNPSEKTFVECVENIPPKCPSDFSITWDYKTNKPYLYWNFPFNTQRDVVKFQVFRRRNLSEPFELVMMYDFDQSEVKYESGEAPNPLLVKKTPYPVSSHFDFDFDFESEYIYAVCCVDAHGFTSNYSSQIYVTFNRRENKMESYCISPAGAPKVYPNILVNKDLFVDSIKTSYMSNVKVYFDPEHVKVYGEEEKDLNFIADSTVGKYTMSIINIDLQNQKNVTFKIKDLLNE